MNDVNLIVLNNQLTMLVQKASQVALSKDEILLKLQLERTLTTYMRFVEISINGAIMEHDATLQAQLDEVERILNEESDGPDPASAE